MAGPKEEKIEKELEETRVSNQDSELSDADIEKVTGGDEPPKTWFEP
jgi:hypothetical protein